jgi:hypothetical protein
MTIGNLVKFEYNGKIRIGRVEQITEKFVRLFIGNHEFRTFQLDKIIEFTIIGG